MALGFRPQPIPWTRSLCPRCKRYPVDPTLLGSKEEGHICGECWKRERQCDEAQPGYDEPPQQWYVCDACDGEGFIPRRVTVYEHGCGFPHDDTHEEPCGKCNGAGGWMDDVEPDR